MAADEPMIRAYVQKVTKKLVSDFQSNLKTPEERVESVLSAAAPRPLAVEGIRDSIRYSNYTHLSCPLAIENCRHAMDIDSKLEISGYFSNLTNCDRLASSTFHKDSQRTSFGEKLSGL